MAMEVVKKGKQLIITIDLRPDPKRTPGGNMLVASSGGNQVTEVMIDGHPVVVGVNAYYKP